MVNISFNADVAEGIGNEAQLMPYLQACNISCGAHAGNSTEIQRVVELAIQHNVGIGAHPSFEDRENFGRIVLPLTDTEIYTCVYNQIYSLNKTVKANSGQMTHVKPHGALYNQACLDVPTAKAVINAIQAVDRSLPVVGLPNSVLENVALQLNCGFQREGFADRAYTNEGVLVNRSVEGSLITSKEAVLEQVKSIVYNGSVKSIDGARVFLDVDTICFHGDTEGAVELLKYCYTNLHV